MGFLTKFIGGTVRATVGTAVNVVADATTMFGVLTDKEEPYSVTNAKKVFEDVEESIEDLTNGDIV